MRNLLVITQRVDEEDDLLGFFVDWIREFAKHFDRVSVITLAKGKFDLPANVEVFSLGKEKGRSKILWPIIFYWRLLQSLPRARGMFAHMSPAFAIAAWPLTALFGKKLVLWYLHRSVTLKLRIAARLCHTIATASLESLNLKSDKIVEVGHGINVNRFRSDRIWDRSHDILRVISVGRLSKIKNYETLIRAVYTLKNNGINLQAEIIGQPVMAPDFEYTKSLNQLVSELNLDQTVKFSGLIPYDRIAECYKKADVAINLAPSGGIDKAVLEAMASGNLILVSNESFRRYLGVYASSLIFKHDDPVDLAEKLIALHALPALEKEKISRFLIEQVSQNHNLSSLIPKLAALI